ncbi:hypothetical protein EV361DRAFT_877200 [Lentinula raphanica]|nr:hypothetical protein EV361DRAFT_877200 [Lentinula raphanica]
MLKLSSPFRTSVVIMAPALASTRPHFGVKSVLGRSIIVLITKKCKKLVTWICVIQGRTCSSDRYHVLVFGA